ncbi:unnamed protein product, partial [Mesorhabditis spiculigera]
MDYEMEEDDPLPQESQRPQINDSQIDELPTTGEGDANDIRILIATDVHVGYAEKKKIIDNDAVNTFEEVLQIGNKRGVDMILLGGDLFHENNPSRASVNKVTALLRKYCMNDKEVALEFLSDPTCNFNHSGFDRVNYEDENLNVGLPLFTIHGNHDDMTGKGLTALDPLHEAGLLNLFGKFTEADNYNVSPILLRKGTTRLALYGMGSQRDDRVARAFQTGTIQFMRPRADAEEWFNLLVLHQNRAKRSMLRSTGAYLPDSYIPSFFDFVLWGHEHECKMAAEYVASSSSLEGDGFYILQPGSTVATSLTKDEALHKHVFILTVRARQFKLEPIPLESVRKMVVDELILDKMPAKISMNPKSKREDEILIMEKIKLMLLEAEKKSRPKQPRPPLVRLKVTYTGEWAKLQPPNGRRLGSEFLETEVANPGEMIMIRRITTAKKQANHANKGDIRNTQYQGPRTVEAMLSEQYRKEPIEDRLSVLTDSFMADTLRVCADDENDSTAKTKEINALLEQAIHKQKGEVSKKLEKAVDQFLSLEEMPLENLNSIEDDIKKLLMEHKKKAYEKDYEREAARAARRIVKVNPMEEDSD